VGRSGPFGPAEANMAFSGRMAVKAQRRAEGEFLTGNEMNALVLRTRSATCAAEDVSACNMNDVREGSAPTAPGCARVPLLTGDWSQGTAVIHRSPRQVSVTLMTNSVDDQ
jgi:hypothetical protein